MKGTEILLDQIGYPLEDGKIQSFILHNEMEDLSNVTFLKFKVWIEIVLTEGELEIRLIEPKRLSDSGDDEFLYQVSSIHNHFSEIKKYFSLELCGFKELVFKKNMELIRGLQLDFKNNATFTIYDQHDKNAFKFDHQLPEDLL